MKIKVALVKELRKKTGASIMDCKKTLVETNGDLEVAIDLMRTSEEAKVANTETSFYSHQHQDFRPEDNWFSEKLHKWAGKNGIGVAELSSGGTRHHPINIEDNNNLCWIASRPYTSRKILEAFSKYRDKDVRSAVAHNYNTPTEVLKELANDKAKNVRRSVADNPYTPEESLIKLSREKDDDIRHYATVNLPESSKEFERLSKDKSESVRESVAIKTNSLEILKRLVKDESETVRQVVASNSATSSAVLKDLAKDVDELVRANVAQNPATLEDALLFLATDKEEHIRRHVANNKNASLKVIYVLTKDDRWS